MSDLPEIKKQIIIINSTKNKRLAQKLVETVPSADIAQILSDLEAEAINDFFKLIDNKQTAFIFSYLLPEHQKSWERSVSR